MINLMASLHLSNSHRMRMGAIVHIPHDARILELIVNELHFCYM